LQFDGPTTILVQTRGPRLKDVLAPREANEIADVQRGVTVTATEAADKNAAVNTIPELARSVEDLTQEIKGTSQSVARIRKDGTVEIDEVGRTN
jgi:phage host-nuclease inhibitor protein Gam